MKKLIKPVFGFAVALSMIACGGAEKKPEAVAEKAPVEEVVEAKEMAVNTAESKVMWEGNMLGLYSHSGTLNITEGMITLKGDQITAGSFTVNVKSMTPTDSAYGEENTAEMLVGHLSSPDFFAVDSFPTASFVIKSADAATKTVTGDLTVRGTTNEETIENVEINAEAGEASGTLTFDRKTYGVSYVHSVKDKVISDDIELDIKLKM